MKTRASKMNVEDMETKTIPDKLISTINKKRYLNQNRRRMIDFFVHKSIGNEIRFGAIRSTKWLTFLVKFMNTPGVESVILNWLDRITYLNSDKLYGRQFNQIFRSKNNQSLDLSFPSSWNSELEKVFEDQEIISTSVQDECSNEVQEMETAVDVSGITVVEEFPVKVNSDYVKVEDDVLLTSPEQLLISPEASEHDSYYVNEFDLSLLPGPCQELPNENNSNASQTNDAGKFKHCQISSNVFATKVGSQLYILCKNPNNL